MEIQGIWHFFEEKLGIIYPQYSGKQPRLNIMPLNSDFRILAKNSVLTFYWIKKWGRVGGFDGTSTILFTTPILCINLFILQNARFHQRLLKAPIFTASRPKLILWLRLVWPALSSRNWGSRGTRLVTTHPHWPSSTNRPMRPNRQPTAQVTPRGRLEY